MSAEHGTHARYIGGCRCDECRRANTVYSNNYSHRPALAADCSFVSGRASRCSMIAGALVIAERDFQAVARRASRSESAYRRYASELAEVKAARANVRAQRDEHMAECDAAVARFGVTA